MNELNEKLARFAWVGLSDDDYEYLARQPENDFTNSLDACFKWLVPKVKDSREIIITIPPDPPTRSRYIVEIAFNIRAEAETLSLALCLAIEKIIDGV